MLRSLSAQEIYPDDTDAKYYTSGMLRTEQTFSLIYGNREHEAFSPFREIDFGDFEMKSYGELKDDPELTRPGSGTLRELCRLPVVKVHALFKCVC